MKTKNKNLDVQALAFSVLQNKFLKLKLLKLKVLLPTYLPNSKTYRSRLIIKKYQISTDISALALYIG